jgi:hypothetical protein
MAALRCGVSTVLGTRAAAHVPFRFGLGPRVAPAIGELGVAASLPGVAFGGEPVGRLAAESRLGGEGRDPRPDVGQLLVGGGEVVVGVGEPRRGVVDEGERAQAGPPTLLLEAEAVQGLAGLFA